MRQFSLCCAVWLFVAVQYAAGQYCTFSAPQPLPAHATGGIGRVLATGINDLGDIVGVRNGTGVTQIGFRISAGVYSQFQPPGSTVTILSGINNVGHIAGSYSSRDLSGPPAESGAQERFGFILIDGQMKALNFPGARGTLVYRINDADHAVGSYWDGATTHGFLFKDGAFTTIDYPNSSTTDLLGINNRGQIVGASFSPHRPPVAFLFESGTFKVLQIDPARGSGFVPFSINDAGQIVGWYKAANAPNLRTPVLLSGGVFTDVPGLGVNSIAEDINNLGQIVGFGGPSFITTAFCGK